MEELIHLSVIIPIYNKASQIAFLHTSVTQILHEQTTPYELIYVDNGSSDTTFTQLQALESADPHVQVIQLQRNVGWSVAVSVGIAQSRGKLLIYLDDELRAEPAEHFLPLVG